MATIVNCSSKLRTILRSSLLLRYSRIASKNLSSTKSAKERVNGVDLHYEVEGDGSHVVLCMPGALGTTQSDFGPQLRGLSKDFTVVAFDPRGYGKSIPPKRDFPPDFFHRDAKDAAELMKKLGHMKYSLLGWSDGGITALILANDNPHCVRRMVVWGSNSYVTKEDMAMIEVSRDVSRWNPRMRDPLEALYGKEGLQELWSAWMDGFGRFLTESNGDICKSALPGIGCPTLIVHGQKDPMVPQFHPDYLHANISNSRLHLMPEGRHNLHLRFADEFNKLVTEFLNEQD